MMWHLKGKGSLSNIFKSSWSTIPTTLLVLWWQERSNDPLTLTLIFHSAYLLRSSIIIGTLQEVAVEKVWRSLLFFCSGNDKNKIAISFLSLDCTISCSCAVVLWKLWFVMFLNPFLSEKSLRNLTVFSSALLESSMLKVFCENPRRMEGLISKVLAGYENFRSSGKQNGS